MSRITELKRQLEEYGAAELTAGALEDISAHDMQRIRTTFEHNRAFYDGIRDLYGIVQTFGKASQPKAETPRLLFVAITSNKRFYGALMRQVIAALSRALGQSPSADALVVGRIGWQYAQQANLTARARQMVLANDEPTKAELAELLTFFEQYNRIFVLFPKFINPFRQDVGVEDITQSLDALPEIAPTVPKKRHLPWQKDDPTYIFEPEVPAILAFFNAQVTHVLFRGVLLEAELARTAARLVHMEEAQDRAHVLVKQSGSRLRRESASVSNSQLLETFAGFALWNQH